MRVFGGGGGGGEIFHLKGNGFVLLNLRLDDSKCTQNNCHSLPKVTITFVTQTPRL